MAELGRVEATQLVQRTVVVKEIKRLLPSCSDRVRTYIDMNPNPRKGLWEMERSTLDWFSEYMYFSDQDIDRFTLSSGAVVHFGGGTTRDRGAQ